MNKLERELLIQYYEDVLIYAKKKAHRTYIKHMIKFHKGLEPYPRVLILNGR